MYPHPPPTRPILHRDRGFTLAELMIAVAIVGVLASLGLVSFRKYADAARMTEPMAVMQSIRISEEQVRREGGRYIDASISGTYFPISNGFGNLRVPWDGTQAKAHPDYDRWKALAVTVDGPVRFGYRVNAGLQGAAITTSIEFKPAPVLPNPPTNDWYIIQAKGNPSLGSKTTMLITASFAVDTITIQDDAP